ncbi:MAG: NAD-glutamate dehydrogenase [Actinomycetia bacterium]|nr:NAD-glutamate dehydrogenase [Actinomycetes bacterium]MCP4084022.1 NAD-glutamate dehydrogenase [Actinomycetes bacterium]
MVDAADQAKQALVDAAVDLAVRRYVDVEPAQTARLIRGYYERVAPQDLEGKQPIDLYAAAVRHLQLAQDRPPDEALVRVYNPRADDDGWTSPHTVVDIVSLDMSFIVDSVLAMLESRDVRVHVLAHPLAAVRRDGQGRLVSIDGLETKHSGTRESFVHLEIDRAAGAEGLGELEAAIRSVLGDVRVAVEDWSAMRAQALDLATELDQWAQEVEDGTRWLDCSVGTDPVEVAALLRWMESGSFIFTGYREYDFVDDDDTRTVSRPATGLGVLRQTNEDVRPLGRLSPLITEQARQSTLVNLTKTNRLSTVHRAVPLDYVGIKKLDLDGTVKGERRFLGLFTNSVYSGHVQEVPVVRAKVQAVIERSGFEDDSHDRSRLLNVLQSHPLDEIMQSHVDDLEETVHDILDLRDRRRVSLLLRPDDFGRFLSVLVYVPRDRHTTDVRLEIQRVLMETYRGTASRFSTEISDAPLARLYVVLSVDPTNRTEPPDKASVEDRLNLLIRSWDDYLRSALVDSHGEDVGLALFGRYAQAFTGPYREEVLAESAVADIDVLQQLPGTDIDVRLHRPLEAQRHEVRCHVYRAGHPITLTELLPMLHDLGATVVDERPYEVTVAGEVRRYIYDVGIRTSLELDAEARSRFRDAMLAVWRGEAESDGLAELVGEPGLAWPEVSILRAYTRYLGQIGSPFSRGYTGETIVHNPEVARLLVDLFRARLEPGWTDEDRSVECRAHLFEAIDAVQSLDADRILRSFVSLIDATVRTNHWQRDADGRRPSALALKFDPTLVPNLPQPVPRAEIFVYSPRVEGVHLRSGSVARGGLRWSDRMEDFRTEILGLMKAQTVKNSVIVPVGAKGGFIAKQLPDGDRDAVGAEVVACYRIFVSALLDITDNLVDQEVVPPADVVRIDENDPYLVVAADKGTAAYSDVANEIALDRHFWLGDAFASGGSSGYDHKDLGITARGAWKSVERHLGVLGIDPDHDEFSVVGIGDMSGDVFGNGMLLSRHIRLVAAFDHRHVFIDPDPDAARSFAERSRLFELRRSSWADYDAGLISTGGGVFSRQAKAVKVTPEAARVLGIGEGNEILTPDELIQAILTAPVDLVWNGGIGTYVKASTEDQAAADDRSNDAVRVDASDLDCRVLVEGGNLGVTQRARIEFARQGGLINTDAIDNSAGVGCSDHEVNLKVLLDEAVRAGDLTDKQRTELLASMADEVCHRVLAANVAQNIALTSAEAQAPGMIEPNRRLLDWLEEEVGLDRELEALPDDSELLELRGLGLGLTRPELSVLLAYAKNSLVPELVDSDLPGDSAFDHHLRAYFPSVIVERFPELVQNHPLRWPLVSTLLVNDIVNRGGLSMVRRLIGETSATTVDVVRAFEAAWRIFELEPLWAEVVAETSAAAEASRTPMLLEITRLAERATRWLLRNETQPTDIEEAVETYAQPIRALRLLLESLPRPELDDEGRTRFDAASLEGLGVDGGLAARIADLGPAFGFLDLASVARRTGVAHERVAGVYLAIADELDLPWLRQRIIDLPRDDHWQTLARSGLRDEFFREHAALTASVIGEDPGPDAEADELARIWLERQADSVERCRQTFSDIKTAGHHDLARVSVAVRALSQLSRVR